MGVPEIEEMAARSVLTPQDDERGLGLYDFSLNPYQGCGIGCSYCYVMRYPFATEHRLGWGEWVRPKVNAPFLLGKARAKVWGKRIFMSSATDPYQYVERRYRLTRKCLEVLLECNVGRLIVHTRSQLVLDDVDLLRGFGDRLVVGFSIATDDDRVRKRLEPKAPRVGVRLKAMGLLREAGVRVRAAVAPVLYCHPKRFAGQLAEVADSAWVDTIRYERQTGLRGFPKVWAYVRSAAYGEMVEELRGRLREVGLM